MTMDLELTVATERRVQLREITRQVGEKVRQAGIVSGTGILFCPHTTAGLLINENADPDVASDLERAFAAAVPEVRFDHAEGNSDSHFLSSIVGSSLNLIVENGSVRLGRWQGIFLCEFDGPRTRRVWLQVLAGR
ncbi:MAG TPA: secondary thiamine-phosphate synthase enzyme YjbQ [Acidobacteriota bacterium]|nr:secondary thiamine-phosphate synthase enzyme YjbQ [Acidobacteriota bacterium]